MRCPKCGYISFDHMETCLKCKKDISGQVEVEGTTYHATAPSFLKVHKSNITEEDDSFVQGDTEQEDDAYEFSDPDLEVLTDEGDDISFEEDDEPDISFDEFDVDDIEDDFQIDTNEDIHDDSSFEFELDDDGEDLLDEKLGTAGFDVPEELSDISDLAPPATEDTSTPSSTDHDEDSLDDDLDLDGLDLNFDLGGDGEVNESELSLSLDDIETTADDLSEEGSDLDNLNMDLDLGELGREDSKTKEKESADDLDKISLSLD